MNTSMRTEQETNTLTAVLAAIQMTREPDPTPQGELGGCVACGRTGASHFQDGRWLGCLKGTSDTVFILVPATRTHAARVVPTPPERGVTRESTRQSSAQPTATANNNESAHAAHASAPVQPNVVARGFVRARYHTMLHHKAKPEKLPLSATRLRVLKKIHEAGRAGLVAKDIMRKAKLPHGSVQSTLDWLRSHNLVEAREDATTQQP